MIVKINKTNVSKIQKKDIDLPQIGMHDHFYEVQFQHQPKNTEKIFNKFKIAV